jgi:hypothetical protein
VSRFEEVTINGFRRLGSGAQNATVRELGLPALMTYDCAEELELGISMDVQRNPRIQGAGWLPPCSIMC